jgi:cobalamin biosynthesis protein CbiD
MTEFLQVQFEVFGQQAPEQLDRNLSETLAATLREIGVEKAWAPEDVQVYVRQSVPLAVETAVLLGLIGLSVKLIDLIMFLKKRQDEARRLDLERAKIEAQRVDEAERQMWRQEFVEQILLAKVLAQANVHPANVVVQIIQR